MNFQFQVVDCLSQAVIHTVYIKWNADISVQYEGYAYEMNLLNVSENESSDMQGDMENVNIIAEQTDGLSQAVIHTVYIVCQCFNFIMGMYFTISPRR